MINLHFGKNYREVNPEEQGTTKQLRLWKERTKSKRKNSKQFKQSHMLQETKILLL